jgi:putative RecB family exonuclease
LSSPDEELKPPPYLSASSINTYLQCPLKFRFNKIDLIPDEPGEAAVLGNFVHDVLEELYKLEPEMRIKQSAKEIAKSLWETTWEPEVKKLIKNAEKLRTFRWHAWWCIEKIWEMEDPSRVSPAGLETEVIADIGGVKIRGFIDRYIENDNGKLIVGDYKTGKTPKKMYLDDKFFQLHIYAKLLSNSGIGETEEVQLLYLKDGVRFSREVTDKDVASMTNTVQTVKGQIDESCKSGNFEARKSTLCNWCSYQKICPAWRKTR